MVVNEISAKSQVSEVRKKVETVGDRRRLKELGAVVGLSKSRSKSYRGYRRDFSRVEH